MARKSNLSVLRRWNNPTFIILVFITLLGAGFRFYNPNWDFGKSFHPDERNILGQTASIQASDGFKVKFFAYGQLPVFLYRATGELISTPSFFNSFFPNQAFLAAFFYWAFLISLFAGIGWLFPRKKFKIPSFLIASGVFLLVLFIKFVPVFSAWFDFLNDWPLKGANFCLDAILFFGVSALLSDFIGLEWLGLPIYIAAGLTFLLGVIPFFLPDAFARTFGSMAFALVVGAAFTWFSWESRWGRLLQMALGIWAIFASFSHYGLQYTGYSDCMIIGRIWAAFFSTLTILVIYWFLNKVYENKPLGLLGSAFFAFSVVSIQVCHYCITESFITLMLVVIALGAYEVSRQGSWKNYLLVGAAFGLSMAAKTSSLYYLFMILIGHLVYLSKTTEKDWLKLDHKNRDDQSLNNILAALFLAGGTGALIGAGYKLKGVIRDLCPLNPNGSIGIWIVLFLSLAGMAAVLFVWGVSKFRVLRAQVPLWLRLSSAGALSFLIFCLLSPWSLLDYQGFMNSMNYEWSVVSDAGACYVLQFKDTPRYIFHLQNLISVELWWPLGITAVLGMVWVLGRFVLQLFQPVSSGAILPAPFLKNKGFRFILPELILLSWFIPYFAFIGGWNTKFIRYMVPLAPVFCIFAAIFLWNVFDRLPKNLERFIKPALLALTVGGSLFYSMAYMHVYRYAHPWLDSSGWIYKNIPLGSKIYNEAWGDGLPVDLNPQQDSRLDRPMNPGLYQLQDLTPYELHGFPTDDSPVKKNYYANMIPQADYIAISSKKLWYTLTDETPEFRPHGFNAYPVTSRYYRALWAGLLGYKMLHEFHNFPSLLGWAHPDDMAEESFSVYDHPRVYIFKKVEQVTPERILEILNSDDYVRGITRDQMRAITPENVDDFISKHNQALEQAGLLQKLNNLSAPATQSPPPPDKLQAEKTLPAIVPPIGGKLPPASAASSSVTDVNAPPVQAPATVPGLPDTQTLKVLQDLADHPVVENDIMNLPPRPEEKTGYQCRAWFTWLALLVVLGWLVLPLTLRILSPISAGAYSLSKVLGFLVFTWVVWFMTSLKITHFTAGACWVWFLLLTGLSVYGYWRDRKVIKDFYKRLGRVWLIQEGVFVFAFIAFTFVRLYSSHVHDPSGEGYNGGGEAGMDFGFLASIVRGETFPPQNMWMAGQPIGYPYYFGHLMMGILSKTLGLVPAVTYNLSLITLFALIFSSAFGLAYVLSGRLSGGWVAGFLCAMASNLTGVKQYLAAINQCIVAHNLSALNGITYDFFGPSRVIPNSINEFPYFSVLYGDMHSHTLAMPFDMLLWGVVASIYLSPAPKLFSWKGDWFKFLVAGFLMGGLVFLNTWDILTGLAIIGITLLVRGLVVLNGKTIVKGSGMVFSILVLAFTLLGWWTLIMPGVDQQALGGSTFYLILFLGLGFLASVLWLYLQKTTRLLSKHLLFIAVGVAGILVTAGLFWIPNFLRFTPQQNKILWVLPSIRTDLNDFIGIYGFFLSILLMSFVLAYSKEILLWVGKAKPEKRFLKNLPDKAFDFLSGLLSPKDPVRGIVSLGFFSLMVVWGASWVHWSEPQGKVFFSQLLASVAAILLVLAVQLKTRWEIWLAEAAVVLLWIVVLSLQGIHLYQDMALTLGLGLCSVLWLLGFFYLGLAVKVIKDRPLSFTYILTALLFLVLAVLELFAVSEFLGGDWMRNNSLFKFGIHAWMLASIAVGALIPKMIDFILGWLKTAKKETLVSKRVLVAVAGVLLFLILELIFFNFADSLQTPITYIINIVVVAGLLIWRLTTSTLKKTADWVLSLGLGGMSIFVSIVSLLPQGSFGSLLNLIQHWSNILNVEFLLPGSLAALSVALIAFLWEGQKNMGATLAFRCWSTLVLILAIAVSIYPLAASIRKCHGFFESTRLKWVGYVESPTLNGLEYMHRSNPGDDAAIRFLNDHVPNQPCLMEFVGAGYNSWGSRFSIFTGIPALMGWDSHVHEWVGKQLDTDIYNRKAAVDQIYETTDLGLAKRMLDAYGVRLVMVGTIERNGAGGKAGYPTLGLAKFANFLPLIYKNPEVEIYYNPPPVRN